MLRKTNETGMSPAPESIGSGLAGFQMVDHATVRAKQRGMRKNPITLVLIYGDRERVVRMGRTILGLSEPAAEELVSEGFRPCDVRQAQAIELVLKNGSTVVTVRRAPIPRRSALLADRGSPRNRIMKARRSRLDWEL